MSEYQYYEFQAVDRPLDEAARQALRELSTRARITATSFVNSYDWGDFKGDPARLMERYFDLFLYLANWGTRRLSIRLPGRLVNIVEVRRFCLDDEVAMVRAAGSHVIIDIERTDVESEEWDGGEGWLASLAPLRADLLSGDLRSLYLVWLMAVGNGQARADAVEPLPGIAPMSASLRAFGDFFGIDRDLLDAAAGDGAAVTAAGPTPTAVESFIRSLSEKERIGFLRRLYDGDDPHLAAELRRRHKESADPSRATGGRLRTAGELRAAAGRLAKIRKSEAEAAEAARRRREEQEKAVARERRLAALAKRGEAAWPPVEEQIALRNGAGYDRATTLLVDLGDIARSNGRWTDFNRRVADIRLRHGRKKGLIDRLDAAGVDKPRPA